MMHKNESGRGRGCWREFLFSLGEGAGGEEQQRQVEGQLRNYTHEKFVICCATCPGTEIVEGWQIKVKRLPKKVLLQ